MPNADDIASENRAAADGFVGGGAFVGEAVADDSRRPFILFRGPWWIVLVVAGLVTIAASILLPLREENRKLAHELARTEREKAYVASQIEANAAFLKQIQDDPALLARVTMRMTNRPAEGTKFLEGADADRKFGSSPYVMTQVAPPPELPAYQTDLPLPIRQLFLTEKPRVIMLVSGVALLAAALVLGGSKPRVAPL